MCEDLRCVPLAMRPRTVPPITRAPWRIFFVTKSFLSKPTGAVLAGVSAGERPSCSAPPAALAFGRSGLANRRSLATVATFAPEAARRRLTGFSFADAFLVLLLLLRLPAGALVAEAADFGALSSLSSRRISERFAVRFLGAG